MLFQQMLFQQMLCIFLFATGSALVTRKTVHRLKMISIDSNDNGERLEPHNG